MARTKTSGPRRLSAFRGRRRRLTGAPPRSMSCDGSATGRACKKAKRAVTVSAPSAEVLLARARDDVRRVFDSVEDSLLDQKRLRNLLSFSQETDVIEAAAADLVEQQRRSRSGGGEPVVGARTILESRMGEMFPMRCFVLEVIPTNYHDVDARGRSKLVRRSVQDVMAKNPAVYDPHRSGVRWTEKTVAAADGVHEFKFGYDADAPLHASSDEGTSSFGGLRFKGPLVVRACRDGDAVDVTRELLKLASAELKRGGWRVQEEHGVQLLRV